VSDLEITALVLSEHEALRRDFAALADPALADPERAEDLGAAWAALAARLEVHAVAEEELFYPLLASAAEHGAAEGRRAVKDHNEIRHAAAAVTGLDAGSEAWWTAVHGAQQVNANHMAEEERGCHPRLHSRGGRRGTRRPGNAVAAVPRRTRERTRPDRRRRRRQRRHRLAPRVARRRSRNGEGVRG